MADGGELFVVAPGVSRFGEDPVVDALIRRHGYHGREAALRAMADDPELAANLAAVAHLIHGSTEGRFSVTYAPGPELSRAEVERVGFRYLALDEALERFPPDTVDIHGSGARAVADLSADRYLEASPLALDLYSGVADLPIVSPHGHVDVQLFADPVARLDPPGRLFVTADHYVVRMLYSQGVPLERAGLRARDEGPPTSTTAPSGRLLADNLQLFALTPTGLWLRETLATVFGIDERLDPASADSIYARVEEQLATPGVRAVGPARPVPGRVPLDHRRRRLDARRAPRARRVGARVPHPADLPSRRGRRARRRPAGAPRCRTSRPQPTARSATTRRSSTALAERRAAFKALGATATDHAATSADTTRLDDREASSLFAAALAGDVSARTTRGASRRTCSTSSRA